MYQASSLNVAPKASVVVPTCDRPSLLDRALNSISIQTFDDFECFVVDDASTADVASIVDQYDDRFRYLRHDENRGASASRNTAIEHSLGEYIAFLDDDDVWRPAKLERQVSLFDSHPRSYGLIYCWADYYEGDQLVQKYRPTHDGYIFPEVLDRQRVGNSSTLMVPRDIAESVGGFDEDLPRGNDGDFIRRIARDYMVDFVSAPLVKVYVDHGRDRISQLDESGLRNAIHGHEVKFEKFGPELEEYPAHAARIHARIAHHYGQLGEWQNSLAHYRRAIETAPATPLVYRLMLSSAKNALLE